MFTGIIAAVGRVQRIDDTAQGRRVAIDTGWAEPDFELGESIAVDGCCLTVVAFDGPVFEAEASQETLDCTSLGARVLGDRVNLEKAMRLGDRLGGHMVAGHVDATGSIRSFDPVGDCLRYVFAVPTELMRYVISKGSVTVDGISLTVNALDDGASTIEVMIVPHTQQNTSLGHRSVGDAVNLEVDLLGKYVERILGPHRDR